MMEIKQEQDHSITSPDESASLPLENDFRIKSYQELGIRQLRKWLKQHYDLSSHLFSICSVNYGLKKKDNKLTINHKQQVPI